VTDVQYCPRCGTPAPFDRSPTGEGLATIKRQLAEMAETLRRHDERLALLEPSPEGCIECGDPSEPGTDGLCTRCVPLVSARLGADVIATWPTAMEEHPERRPT